jgi:hypothetical protein
MLPNISVKQKLNKPAWNKVVLKFGFREDDALLGSVGMGWLNEIVKHLVTNTFRQLNYVHQLKRKMNLCLQQVF